MVKRLWASRAWKLVSQRATIRSRKVSLNKIVLDCVGVHVDECLYTFNRDVNCKGNQTVETTGGKRKWQC